MILQASSPASQLTVNVQAMSVRTEKTPTDKSAKKMLMKYMGLVSLRINPSKMGKQFQVSKLFIRTCLQTWKIGKSSASRFAFSNFRQLKFQTSAFFFGFFH